MNIKIMIYNAILSFRGQHHISGQVLDWYLCHMYMGENTVFLAPKNFFLIFLGLLVIEMRDIGIGSV